MYLTFCESHLATQSYIAVLLHTTAGGVALAAYGEVNLSIIGLIFMFSSETGEAIRLVMTQVGVGADGIRLNVEGQHPAFATGAGVMLGMWGHVMLGM
jgi:hypothetical protein